MTLAVEKWRRIDKFERWSVCDIGYSFYEQFLLYIDLRMTDGLKRRYSWKINEFFFLIYAFQRLISNFYYYFKSYHVSVIQNSGDDFSYYQCVLSIHFENCISIPRYMKYCCFLIFFFFVIIICGIRNNIAYEWKKI